MKNIWKIKKDKHHIKKYIMSKNDPRLDMLPSFESWRWAKNNCLVRIELASLDKKIEMTKNLHNHTSKEISKRKLISKYSKEPNQIFIPFSEGDYWRMEESPTEGWRRKKE